ncbi:UPF0182 family protein [Tessaracoccus coleopterorum]|uniref:UPF0182 family protein n=1 Tax=Tessaracoccus coleopterorum TaxID=2714950 RepID=UPI002F915766
MRWPGDETPHFANTTVFVPKDRENLSVYMGVNSDATSKAYGQKRVLKLSDSKQIAGPGQTYNFISTNPEVAEKLLPFNRDGSSASAIYGNLLTLPMGGGLLYVQPIYTQTKTSGSYPALRFVVVRFGDQLGIGESLQAALDQVFQGDAGADTGEGTRERPPPEDPNAPPSDQTGSERARGLLDEAEALFKGADEALKTGDLAAYQSRMKSAEEKVVEAAKALDEG